MMQAAEQYFVEFKQVTQHPRSLITQVLNLACIVLSALMMWKGLMVCTQSESPVVVVLSGSMEPGFYRGDILGLTLFDDPLKNADIVVFQIEGRDVPIVHRYVFFCFCLNSAAIRRGCRMSPGAWRSHA